MPSESAQKFITRNKKPRVHIVYDVDTGNATVKKELPFIMGVMADLSGKPEEALPEVKDRKFINLDKDNFESFLKANKPRIAFQVKNALTGEGSLSVEMTFESMADFSPAAVARKVEGVNRLFTLRTQLASFLDKADGKAKAEKLLAELLAQPELQKALAAQTPSESQPKT